MTEWRVKVADHAIAEGTDTIATIGLGSCVAVMIHAPAASIGALAHVLLPDATASRAKGNAAKFADSAVPLLVGLLRERGATGPLVAKLAGGASMFQQLLGLGGINMGDRNIEATRAALKLAGIGIIAEDVGGDYGRSVWFRVADGTATIRSLRGGDRVL